MSRYALTVPARADLFAIWDYIAEESGPDRADRMITELHEAMHKLAEMPGMGHVRDDLANEPLRVWPVHAYLVIYRPDTSPLQVVRVLHGARDLKAILGDE
jgi:plasmid stabilization system protein ParE